MNKKYIIILIFSAIIFGGCRSNNQQQNQFLENRETEELEICDTNINTDTCSANVNENEEEAVKVEIKKQVDFSEMQQVFQFLAQIPKDWQVELISEIEAINIYNPNLNGSNLEKSVIFIRYFKANDFLTLSTVNIYSKENTVINEKSAVVYDIEKKLNVRNFSNQPSWRNQRHMVTDIRSSDKNPATFYVFAKSPNLEDDVFDEFLKSIQISVK